MVLAYCHTYRDSKKCPTGCTTTYITFTVGCGVCQCPCLFRLDWNHKLKRVAETQSNFKECARYYSYNAAWKQTILGDLCVLKQCSAAAACPGQVLTGKLKTALLPSRSLAASS